MYNIIDLGKFCIIWWIFRGCTESRVAHQSQVWLIAAPASNLSQTNQLPGMRETLSGLAFFDPYIDFSEKPPMIKQHAWTSWITPSTCCQCYTETFWDPAAEWCVSQVATKVVEKRIVTGQTKKWCSTDHHSSQKSGVFHTSKSKSKDQSSNTNRPTLNPVWHIALLIRYIYNR